MLSATPNKFSDSLRSLGLQLTLLITACMTSAIAAFGIHLADEQANANERDTKQRAAVLAHYISGDVANNLVARDFIGIERQLAALNAMPGLRHIYVINHDGTIISHVAADADGNLNPVFKQEQLSLPNQASAEQFDAGETLETWEPIRLDNVIGWIRLLSDLQPVYAGRQAIYRHTAAAGLLAVLVSLTALFLFLRPRITALNSLANFARRLDTHVGEQLKIYRGSSDIEAVALGLNQASERLAADEQLLRLHALQLRTVVENMPVLMDAFDEHGHIIVWNKECERVSGYSAAEIIGNPHAIEMLYPDPDYRNVMLNEWQTRSAGFRDWALTLTAKSGAQRTIAWSNFSTEFPIPGWASWSIGIDITQTLENERLKDEFVSTVNHELRTPLTAIHGSLRLVASNTMGKIPDGARQLIDLAERNCERLMRLITNVLDMQRLQTGQVALTLKPLDMDPLVKDAIEVNQPYAAQHGVRLILAPITDSDVTAVGDHDKLLQVLTNLISNAIKFSPTETTVEVSVKREVNSIRIAVRDEGPGVPETFSNKIFRRFSRASDSPTSHVGGSGLGLYISKSIVEHHSGRIGFENNPDKGATFYVWLPAEQANGVANISTPHSDTN